MTIRSIQAAADDAPDASKTPPMLFVVRTISPEVAQAILARPYSRQRSISRSLVVQYARAMTDGRWLEPTIDPIAFTPDGLLLNGQHRLQALIKTGLTIDMLVVENATPEMFKFIDTARRRSAGQFVGRPSAATVASAARFYLWAKRALPEPPTPMNLSFAMDELLDVLDGPSGDLIEESVRSAQRVYRASNVPSSIHATVIALAIEQGADPQRIEDGWIQALEHGIGLDRDDPRRLLRERMRAHTGGSRRSAAATWSLVVRAFNAWYQGRRLGTLRQGEWDEPSPAIDLEGTSNAAVKARKRRVELSEAVAQ
jgi:hypothetical protein